MNVVLKKLRKANLFHCWQVHLAGVLFLPLFGRSILLAFYFFHFLGPLPAWGSPPLRTRYPDLWSHWSGRTTLHRRLDAGRRTGPEPFGDWTIGLYWLYWTGSGGQPLIYTKSDCSVPHPGIVPEAAGSEAICIITSCPSSCAQLRTWAQKSYDGIWGFSLCSAPAGCELLGTEIDSTWAYVTSIQSPCKASVGDCRGISPNIKMVPLFRSLIWSIDCRPTMFWLTQSGWQSMRRVQSIEDTGNGCSGPSMVKKCPLQIV